MNEAELLAAAIAGKIELSEELARGYEIQKAFYNDPSNRPTEEEAVLFDAFTDFSFDFINTVAEYNKFESVWCATTLDFTVPYEGAPVAVYYDGGWGADQTVKLPENPTILDVWKACDEAIRKSGDHHHVFIEILEFTSTGELNMKTGS